MQLYTPFYDFIGIVNYYLHARYERDAISQEEVKAQPESNGVIHEDSYQSIGWQEVTVGVLLQFIELYSLFNLGRLLLLPIQYTLQL